MPLYRQIVENDCPSRLLAQQQINRIELLLNQRKNHSRVFTYEYTKDTPIGFSYGKYNMHKVGGFFGMSVNKNVFDMMRNDCTVGDMPEVNWGMPVTSLKAAYSLDPAWGMGEEFEKNNLFGVAGTLWSECINSPERIYYQAYPRSLALAEAGWSFQKNRSWEGFLTRLKPTVKDMMRRGITFSMEY